MIDNAVFSRLSNDGAINALIGTRIYPQMAKEDATYPLILYHQISSGQADARCMAGVADHFRTLVQIDIYGPSKSGINTIAKAVRASLDDKIKQTWGGLKIAASMFDDQFDSGYEPGSNLYRIIQQYRIVLEE